MEKLKIYLASGWFNDEQKKQMNEVHARLLQMETEKGNIEFFAPFHDGIVLEKDDPNIRRKMKFTWELDISKVQWADIIIVCTQDHDVGTIFEAGYGSAKGKILFCYNSKPELGLNLMLSQEAKAFCKDADDLENAITKYIKSDHENRRNFSYNVWEGNPI